MYRISRAFLVAALVSMPAAALARPPLIYHRAANLVAHPSGTVRLVLSRHDVVVHVRKGDSVTVTTEIWAGASSESAKQDIIKRLAPRVSAKGDDILVEAPRQHGWSINLGWGAGPEALVTVTLPPGMAVNYRLGSGDFRFDNPGADNAIQGWSGSGDVVVKSAAKALAVKAGSGDITVVHAGDKAEVRLRTGSGDIVFSGAAGSLKAGAGSGDIMIHDAAAGAADLSTGSGDIIARWRKFAAGGAVAASAGSGDVEMYFPSDTVIGGRIATGSGDVDTQFPATIQGNHHAYTLAGGSGAVQVDLSTGSGDVSLRKGG